MAFVYPLDIVNRGLQHLGIHRSWSLNAATAEAVEANAVYDDVRLAELQRNLWKFATRRVILRAVGIDSVVWTPPAWSSGTSYSAGAVVQYAPVGGPYNSIVLNWVLTVAEASSTVPPDQDPLWQRYAGPIAVDLYNTGPQGTGNIEEDTNGQNYQSGEVVLVPATYASGTTYGLNNVVAYEAGGIWSWYVSLVTGNIGNTPSTSGTKWALWTSQGRSQSGWGVTATQSPIPLIYPAGWSIYVSLYSNNGDNPLAATVNWLSLGGSIVPLQMVWPIGTGPSDEENTLNCFYLPDGFLKRAPTDPKANQSAYLGAASGANPEDWVIEGNLIVSSDAGPIMMRFIHDVIDVPLFDPMFCEGLGARIAVELASTLCEPKQVAMRKADARVTYRQSMGEARMTNSIEEGPISPVENRYVTVRV